ncbi:MAG: Transposase, family [Pseudonocardia sp.]|nr:Transposase, family [Pseudonocardia sp.]
MTRRPGPRVSLAFIASHPFGYIEQRAAPAASILGLSMDEGRRLQRITRTAKDPVRLRRAIVVMMSGQGQAVGDIVSLLQVSDDYVRDVVHAFNERGFDALNPKWSGRRPRRIGEQLREWICLIARRSPAEWGITGFSTWSLTKLREHLLAEGIVAAISRETLRRILRDAGVSWQTTTTWKASTDPDFIAKMRRILELYDHPPEDGRVVCVDEFGPLNLLPRKGKSWQFRGRPRWMRATYHRYDGVMHMLAALDLATGKLFYRIRPRKRATEFLDLLTTLQARPEAVRGVRQLLPAPPRRRPGLVRRSRGRVGVRADLQLLVELDSRPSSRRCATSRSMAPITAATPSRTPPSPTTSAGTTPELRRRSTSLPTHRSEPGPITRPQGCVTSR